MLFVIVLLCSRISGVKAEYFPFENVRLTETDVGDFSAIRFGNPDHHAMRSARCKAFPGSSDWPALADWDRLNISLGGALLRPDPPGAACYPSDPAYDPDRCRYLVQQAGRTHFWLDDPLTTLTQWPQGNTCLPSLDPAGNCTRGGSPEYVVSATTVRHIQTAVNFARNTNVRLVIKNTGHDFGGRSMGAGALSVWVHNFKDFEFIPEYNSDVYSGMAVRVGAGVESWETFNHMAQSGNITVVAPGGATVGSVGGWLATGGHGGLTSKFGLGADQALEINLVTADGRFLTASSSQNADLFWALRGGGPSTYGIMTSAILKAYPPLKMTSIPLSFSVNYPLTLPPNLIATLPGFVPPLNNSTNLASSQLDKFWEGVSLAYRFGPKVQSLGGFTYSYIYPLGGNNSFAFATSHSIPDISPEAITALHKPLFETLNKLGINVTLNNPQAPTAFYGSRRSQSAAAQPAQTRYRSRLFPAANFADQNNKLYARTFSAIRAVVEQGGYTFHGIGYSPTLEIAGSPGNASAVIPAWRETVLHGSLMEIQPLGLTASEARERDVRAKRYIEAWGEVIRLGGREGSYMNEGDPGEDDWQKVFFGGGAHYKRLLGVKKTWDPWGVFWARTTVGSEGWEVISQDRYPYGQNGRLCRV